MPVLPAVPSTMTPPGFSSPRSSAASTIWRAGRSFTDWPGFRNSALPRISQPVASEARRSRISGVLPIASMTVGLTSMGMVRRSGWFPWNSARNYSHPGSTFKAGGLANHGRWGKSFRQTGVPANYSAGTSVPRWP